MTPAEQRVIEVARKIDVGVPAYQELEEAFEALDEQPKPAEPKFKVGDWVRHTAWDYLDKSEELLHENRPDLAMGSLYKAKSELKRLAAEWRRPISYTTACIVSCVSILQPDIVANTITVGSGPYEFCADALGVPKEANRG